MDDLIRREDALNALNLVDAPFLPMNTNEHIAYVYALKNLPSVDAVEVVRCKDCKWCDTRINDDCHNPRFGNGWANYPPPSIREDFFCGDGERKTDG